MTNLGTGIRRETASKLRLWLTRFTDYGALACLMTLAALLPFADITFSREMGLILGILFIVGPNRILNFQGSPPPPFIGWILTIAGGSMMLLGWAFAICLIMAGRFIAKQKHYIFCLVMASLNCLFMPFGTVLGVFTIVVLMRPPVKAMFVPSENLELTV